MQCENSATVCMQCKNSANYHLNITICIHFTTLSIAILNFGPPRLFCVLEDELCELADELLRPGGDMKMVIVHVIVG